jgi:hypothetical protein
MKIRLFNSQDVSADMDGLIAPSTKRTRVDNWRCGER